MSIQEIKSRLSMQEVLQHYGLKPNRNKMLNCPFHNDKTPSMQVYEDSNTAFCFSANCELNGKSIDQIDFIMHKEGISKGEAISKAKDLVGITDILKQESNLENTFQTLKKNLLRSSKAQQYLKSRNLSDVNEIGYNHRTLKEVRDCIVFPLKDKEEKIVSFYGRSITGPARAKKETDCNNKTVKKSTNYVPGCHYYTTNRQGLYPNYPCNDVKILILTESVIDALSVQDGFLRSSNNVKNTAVLALYGTNGFNNEHSVALSQLKQLKEVIFFLDGDEAGRKSVAKYSKEIYRILPEVKISMVNTPENEDPNSIVQKGVFSLEDLINNRSVIYSDSESVENVETAKQSKKIIKAGHLDTSNSEYFYYREKNIETTIIGGINLYPVDKLKVTLKLSKMDSHNPFDTIREKVDLYSHDEIEKFVRKISDILGVSSKELQIMLLNLAEQLENYRSEQIELQKPKKIEKRQLTQKRQETALKWLKKADLLKRTNDLIGKSGVVGEEKNRLLMYLIFTSRLREQPLHIMSLGSSASGKTYLQETVSELIPEDQKLEITTLSENALYYFEREELKHKLVLIEDLDGANDDKVLYAIRELMSKKRISKTIPIKDVKGNLKTITLQVEGPISLTGTTTREKLYEDNSNRSILIYLDNSKSQKEAIMAYQRASAAGQINKISEMDIKEFFKDIQSVLKPIKVINPYAPKLIIPEEVFKPLRTNTHYLSFIEIITFYKQYQRERKVDLETGEEYIETTLEDIEEANELIKDVLLAKSDELTNASRNFLEMLKSYLSNIGKDTFYSKELRKECRITPTTLKRRLRELNAYGYIKIIGGTSAKGYEYELVANGEYDKLKSNIDDALEKAFKSLNEWASGPPVGQN